MNFLAKTIFIYGISHPLLLAMSNNSITTLNEFTAQAQQGHANAMIPLIENCIVHKEYRDAATWLARFYVRGIQDCACLEDLKSSWMEPHKIAVTYTELYQKIEEHIPKERMFRILNQQCEWAHTRELTNDIPAPYWLAPAEDCYPEEKWAEKRKNALAVFKEKLEANCENTKIIKAKL